MNHAYTQKELSAALDAGDSIMVGYRSAASLKWSDGAKEIILQPHQKKQSGMPYTLRNRRMLVAPELFHKMQQY